MKKEKIIAVTMKVYARCDECGVEIAETLAEVWSNDGTECLLCNKGGTFRKVKEVFEVTHADGEKSLLTQEELLALISH